MRVALVSLEPWDDVWRRNQHLSAELVRQGLVSELTFIEPPVRGLLRSRVRHVEPGVRVVTPPSWLKKRFGGLRLVAAVLNGSVLRGLDLLWVNDPSLGVQCLGRYPVLYDVTDDWREARADPPTRRRLVAAEDRLATVARTVVCSGVLRQRWRDRYGVEATLVSNGVDMSAASAGRDSGPLLPGAPPHVGYVGTLHEDRLDVDLVVSVSQAAGVGSVHLVGPDSLTQVSRRQLRGRRNVYLHGPVAASDVPAWMRGLDVLLCPHVVTPFTLSLDAIKAYEYQASGRPIVATPTSGFQSIEAEGVWVEAALSFPAAVVAAALSGRDYGPRGAVSWAVRARAFGDALAAAADAATATT